VTPNVYALEKPQSASSLYEKLNTTLHKPALLIFMVIVIGHWGEHLFQAYRVYGLHWPRPKAPGMLGLFYPRLIQTDALHYAYALIMLIGIWLLRRGFTGLSLTWWTVSLWIRFSHHIEHAALQYQAITRHYWFHPPVPESFLQAAGVPRIELHLLQPGARGCGRARVRPAAGLRHRLDPRWRHSRTRFAIPLLGLSVVMGNSSER
jgi:hypothetical protein